MGRNGKELLVLTSSNLLLFIVELHFYFFVKQPNLMLGGQIC
jgi:hypothetical protein